MIIRQFCPLTVAAGFIGAKGHGLTQPTLQDHHREAVAEAAVDALDLGVGPLEAAHQLQCILLPSNIGRSPSKVSKLSAGISAGTIGYAWRSVVSARPGRTGYIPAPHRLPYQMVDPAV